jgi:hypothetical protein
LSGACQRIRFVWVVAPGSAWRVSSFPGRFFSVGLSASSSGAQASIHFSPADAPHGARPSDFEPYAGNWPIDISRSSGTVRLLAVAEATVEGCLQPSGAARVTNTVLFVCSYLLCTATGVPASPPCSSVSIDSTTSTRVRIVHLCVCVCGGGG